MGSACGWGWFALADAPGLDPGMRATENSRFVDGGLPHCSGAARAHSTGSCDPKTDSSRPCGLAWLDGGVLAFCHIKDRRQEGLKWRCTCLGASKAGSVSSRFLPSGARAPLPQFHSACAHPDIRRDPAGEGFGNEMDVGESCCSVAVLSAPEPEGSLGVSVWRGALLHTALCTSPPPDRGP